MKNLLRVLTYYKDSKGWEKEVLLTTYNGT
jgi:hypothetical protein